MSRPDAACSSKLCYFLEEIVVNVPEEREPRSERVNVQPAGNAALHIRESISERECQLLCRRRSRLADVIAGNGDGIPLRNILRRPLEAINNESERRLDRE